MVSNRDNVSNEAREGWDSNEGNVSRKKGLGSNGGSSGGKLSRKRLGQQLSPKVSRYEAVETIDTTLHRSHGNEQSS